MRFSMITILAASVAAAIAMPAMEAANAQATGNLCSSPTASNPVCCATDIIGVANIDCASREFLLPACASTWSERRSPTHIALLTASRIPNDIPDFNRICSESGLRARCCLVAIVRKFHSIPVDAVLHILMPHEFA